MHIYRGPQWYKCPAKFKLMIILICAGEFRKLLAAFVSGSTAKSGGIIRKITPTSAELKDTPTANRSQQKLQVSQCERQEKWNVNDFTGFKQISYMLTGGPWASFLSQPTIVAAPHCGVCGGESRFQRCQAHEVSVTELKGIRDVLIFQVTHFCIRHTFLISLIDSHKIMF